MIINSIGSYIVMTLPTSLTDAGRENVTYRKISNSNTCCIVNINEISNSLITSNSWPHRIVRTFRTSSNLNKFLYDQSSWWRYTSNWNTIFIIASIIIRLEIGSDSSHIGNYTSGCHFGSNVECSS